MLYSPPTAPPHPADNQLIPNLWYYHHTEGDYGLIHILNLASPKGNAIIFSCSNTDNEPGRPPLTFATIMLRNLQDITAITPALDPDTSHLATTAGYQSLPLQWQHFTDLGTPPSLELGQGDSATLLDALLSNGEQQVTLTSALNPEIAISFQTTGLVEAIQKTAPDCFSHSGPPRTP